MSPQITNTTEPESPPYIFTARELRRLAVYRAAIVAGFYTDGLQLEASSSPRLQDVVLPLA